MKEQNKYRNLEKTFLEYIRQYDGAFTYCKEMKRGMASDQKLYAATSINEYKQVMSGKDYFELRHLNKVDSAYEYFKERLCVIALEADIKVEDIP